VITGGSSIAAGAFFNCVSLNNVTIPDSVTSIGDDAFSGCSSLQSITLPLTFQIFGRIFGTADYNVQNDYIPSTLKTVVIRGGIIRANMFNGCANITSVTISGVSVIGNSAFVSCTSLTSVTFEEGNIISLNFPDNAFPEGSDGAGGNSLKTAYLRTTAPVGGAGTYTRANGGDTWAKQ